MRVTPAQAQTIDYAALQQLFGEPVTTSATGSPQRTSEVPVTMEIITADDIRRSGARDVPGILQHVLGIDVMQFTNDQAEVGIRGYAQAFSSRLLVLVDGRQVYADYFGFTPWAAVPVELNQIRQIEIVKGPSMALFGFNAVGGVINIITANPLYDSSKSFSASGGTQDLVEGSATVNFKVGDTALRVSGGGRLDKDFATPLPTQIGTRLHTAGNRGEINVAAVTRLTDKVVFEVDASHSLASLIQINPIYQAEFVKYTTDSIRGQITADTSLGLIHAEIYSNWTKHDAPDTPGLGDIAFRNQVTVAQLNDVLKLTPNHTFRAALEYRHNTESTTPFVGGNVFYDIVSAAGMWEWKLSQEISLTNAVRVDHLMLGRNGAVPVGFPFTNADWNLTHTEVAFNSGVVWNAGKYDTLRLTVSRGIQLPNLTDFGAFLVVTPFVNVTGVPTIEPIRVMNYAMDWDRQLPSLDGHLRVSVFHQNSIGVISTQGAVIPSPGGPYFVHATAGNTHATGVEVNVKGAFLQSWRWGLGARHESVVDRFLPFAEGGAAFLDYEHTTPQYVANANLGWTATRWEIDGFVRYQTRTYGLRPLIPSAVSALVRVPAYAAVDGRIGYHLTPSVTLAISGQNLLKATQIQTSAAAVERRVLGTLTFNFQ